MVAYPNSGLWVLDQSLPTPHCPVICGTSYVLQRSLSIWHNLLYSIPEWTLGTTLVHQAPPAVLLQQWLLVAHQEQVSLYCSYLLWSCLSLLSLTRNSIQGQDISQLVTSLHPYAQFPYECPFILLPSLLVAEALRSHRSSSYYWCPLVGGFQLIVPSLTCLWPQWRSTLKYPSFSLHWCWALGDPTSPLFSVLCEGRLCPRWVFGVTGPFPSVLGQDRRRQVPP